MSGARRLTRPAILVALTLMVAACGDSPTEPGAATPAGTVEVAGNWSGTWTFTVAGVTVTDDVTASLTLTGASASGTWTGASGASGRLNFNAMATLSGTLTINQATLGGTTCNATTAIQGTASSTELVLTLANIAPQGICQWGTSGRFVLGR